MDTHNRQIEYKLITALLRDVHTSHGVVFTTKSLRLTLKKVEQRLSSEGLGFLTKTLPRLGKALDRALTGAIRLNANSLGFQAMPNSELPLFCGEFFSRIFHPSGTVLQDPCADSVRILRQILYLLYKYELPYSAAQEHKVIQAFTKAEDELADLRPILDALASSIDSISNLRRRQSLEPVHVAREARILLSRVFSGFDLSDIVPRHGPGAVATRQQLWGKYQWTNVSSRIRKHYPVDAYFYASLGHVCDSIESINALGDVDHPARVLLVPKDSRGPRLISCEPVDFQWIQQGISSKLVQHLENIELTKYNIFFTNQQPNQFGALLGSKTGRYATLDLKEASDRVSVDLVRLLFPPHVSDVLVESARSTATVLPDGKILELRKFAPMGSALCFPIMALTIWALLTAAAPDTDTRESILVYGDDVIVPTAFAVNAMNILESFGLRINRDKSCTAGLFRESCGTDAFKGEVVTPVRIRTLWSHRRCPESYTSWISYANSFYDKKYYHVYDLIVDMLHTQYGPIPSDDMNLSCPSLREVSEDMLPKRSRYNQDLQKTEYLVRDVSSPSIKHEINGWSMLLRYFVEAARPLTIHHTHVRRHEGVLNAPFSVRLYTKRRRSMLRRRWR